MGRPGEPPCIAASEEGWIDRREETGVRNSPHRHRGGTAGTRGAKPHRSADCGVPQSVERPGAAVELREIRCIRSLIADVKCRAVPRPDPYNNLTTMWHFLGARRKPPSESSLWLQHLFHTRVPNEMP